jgi:hypothetical protein
MQIGIDTRGQISQSNILDIVYRRLNTQGCLHFAARRIHLADRLIAPQKADNG